jgi:4,5-dihydroxyphthalate decarboxylase
LTEKLILRACLGRHNHVEPLKTGAIRSRRVELEFVECDPLPRAFRDMVRERKFDICEMALTTHLLALDFAKPLSALPIPLWRRLHHANLVCLVDSAISAPKDLEGKRVGVRAYSQTTGVWIRGILETEYGVDLDHIQWVTIEDAHVAEYRDPASAIRVETGNLREMLYSGTVDAIMGERNVDPADVRSVIPDSEVAGKEWSRRSGIVPVNHIVSIRTELLEQHPWLAEELMQMFEDARIASAASGVAVLPYGLEPNRSAMQMLCRFAAGQKLTAREYDVEEIFSRDSF